MDFLPGLSGSLLLTIPAFLAVLTVVVFFHELGHFLVARWCGVAVSSFSVGFGPELFGRTDKHGTRWKLSAIPLGGYVKFIDDMNPASTPDRSAAPKPGSFQGQSVGRRAAIVAAGPIASFLLGIVICAGLFATLGKPVTDPVVDGVVAGTPAAEAGFVVGDRILTIDGNAVETFNDVQRAVLGSGGQTLTIAIDRSGQRLTLSVTPRLGELTDPFGNRQKVMQLGLSRTDSQPTIKTFSPVGAVVEAVKYTWYIITSTIEYIGHVFLGRASADQIGGPIGIAKMSGEAASLGVIPLVNLAAVLSISIGLLNLFPVPLLDGGHLVYYAIEAIRGRPLSDKAQDYGFRVGFAIVLMLMVLGTFNDIVRIATG